MDINIITYDDYVFNDSSQGNYTSDISDLQKESNYLPWVFRLILDILLGMLLGFLCFLTVAGNALVLHAVRKERALQTVSNMYIVSLAIADLTVGVIVMPISTIYIFTKDWLFGLVVCQFWIGVDYIASTASILNLFILSLDRYWSVTSPLVYLRRRTKRRALTMISAVWALSSLWLIPIVAWHQFANGGVRTVPSNVCDTEYATNTALKIITGILNYYLPLTVMYSLYSKIYVEIRKRSKMEIGQRNVIKKDKAIGAGSKSGTPEPNESRELINKQDISGDRQGVCTQYSHLNCSHYGSMGTEIQDKQGAKQVKQANIALNCYLKPKITYATPSDSFSSEGNDENLLNAYYAYDEVMLDPSTEYLHRYCSQYVNTVAAKRYSIDNQNQPLSKSSPEPNTSVNMQPICGQKQLSDSCIQPLEKGGQIDNNGQHKCNSNIQPSNVKMVSLSPLNTPKFKSTKRSKGVPVLLSKSHDQLWVIKQKLSSPKHSVSTPAQPASQTSETSDKVSKHLSTKPTGPTASLMGRIRQTIRHRHKRINSSLQKEIKAARQLGVIMGAFTVCFLPYFVCFMVVSFCSECVPNNLTVAVTWIGYLNSTLNPILYPLCNATFKKTFRKILSTNSKDNTKQYSGPLRRGYNLRKPRPV